MESMFTLTGQVINVFVTPKGVNKSSGEEYGGQDKVQVLGDIPLPNGETKKDIVTLTTHNASDFKSLTGSTVSLPVSFYAPSKGQVIFFIPKGYKPSEAA